MPSDQFYRSRRGVLLLIILALLALFAMMAVAFVVLTGQARRSSESFRELEASAVNPKIELERAFAQVLRGTNDPGSVLGAHSLLEDLYGNSVKIGQINSLAEVFRTPWPDLRPTDPNDAAPRPLLEFAVSAGSAATDPQFVGATPINDRNGLAAAECAGCVLTMLNGPAAGVSTRVVAVLPRHQPDPLRNPNSLRPLRLQVLAKDDLNFARLRDYFLPPPADAANSPRPAPPPLKYIINGAPFSGTGFGLNLAGVRSGGAAQKQLDSTALLPNLRDIKPFATSSLLDGEDASGRRAPSANSLVNQPVDAQPLSGKSGNIRPYYGPAGGANEDYDAPDHQNMLLALVRPPARIQTPDRRPVQSHPYDYLTTVPIPSLHRADLYRYWTETRGAKSARQVVQFTMRPLPAALLDGKQYEAAGHTFKRTGEPLHPNFSGSNPRFHPGWDGTFIDDGAKAGQCKYQWDVDNDGDGIPDSVWVDLGMPVRAAADGRLCKPLFAILCTDLDGRLNLNAHGSAEQATSNSTIPVSGAEFSASIAGGRRNVFLPRGRGYGPAEINLGVLFDANNPLRDFTVNGEGAYANGPYRRLLWGVLPPDFTRLPAEVAQQLPGDLPLYEGRYGDLELLLAQKVRTLGPQLAAGQALPRPGYPGQYSPWMVNKHGSYAPAAPPARRPAGAGDYPRWPGMPSSATQPLDIWGTPPNLDGNCALCLDRAGRPIYWGFAPSFGNRGYADPSAAIWSQLPAEGQRNYWPLDRQTNYALNSPYELNLFQEAAYRRLPALDGRNGNALPGPLPMASDAPFTPAELERVLRPFDVDTAQLPNRLLRLTDPDWPNLSAERRHGLVHDPNASALLSRRHEVTTESWDLPCPPLVVDKPLPGQGTEPYGGNPILRRLQQVMNGYRTPRKLPPVSGEQVLQWAHALLAPETVAGLRMDLNRPFGNGRDDDGDGVVDSPFEGRPGATSPASTEWRTYYSAQLAPQLKGGPQDPEKNNSGGNCDAANGQALNASPGRWENKLAARQWYARNLYCLALLLLDVQNDRQRCREIAQWAVNVVDFMDRDSIMTRFDYELAPFDPGAVQGPGGAPLIKRWNPPRDGTCTVFGCERPELLITETLAFHDRRTEDTDRERDYLPWSEEHGTRTTTAADPHDADYDQRLRPQGSLFVELFHPWPANEPRPGELTGGHPLGGIRLDLVTPLPPGSPAGARGTPVWRMLIGKPLLPQELAQYDLGAHDPVTQAFWANKIERYVYFTAKPFVDSLPLTERPLDQYDKCTHYRGLSIDPTSTWPIEPPATAAGLAAIQPGQYALIGPGEPRKPQMTLDADPTKAVPPERTFLGFDASYAHADGLHFPVGDARYIDLSGKSAVVYNGKDASGTPPRDAAGRPLPIRTPIVPVAVNWPRRLNISEPCDGYEVSVPQSIAAFRLSDDGLALKATAASPGVKAGMTDLTLNYPLDTLRTGDAYAKSRVLQSDPAYRYRVVYLQRLADPTRPFNGNVTDALRYNPYLMIDAMPVDLYAFNGADVYSENELTTKPKPFPPLFSSERGESSLALGAAASSPTSDLSRNIWLQEQLALGTVELDNFIAARASTRPAPKEPPSGTAESSLYHVAFRNTLGYLNQVYGVVQAGLPEEAAGYPADQTPAGDKLQIFPWFAWNNRPFVSQLELLLVPRANSASLLRFPFPNDPEGHAAPQAPPPPFSLTPAYGDRAHANPYINDPQVLPFRHLLPFFLSARSTDERAGPRYHRLLDYVHVPSRFAGAELQLPPEQMQTSVWAGAQAPPHAFHTPFHWVSAYREPGRVNLNTMFSFDVWRGLANGARSIDVSDRNAAWDTTADLLSMWRKIVISRKGHWSSATAASASSPGTLPPVPASDAVVTDEMLCIDPTVPSRFGNPFRSSAGGRFLPPELSQAADRHVQSLPLHHLPVREEVEATLLRPDPDDLHARYHASTELTNAAAPPACKPLFSCFSQQPHNNTQRNPAFAFQNLQRLGNLTTTRSNVYAVWITVGYFEVAKVPAAQFDPLLYPDGYQLGQEVGYDTGEVRRHRAFYLLDRSIPVGFFRGQDVNSEKAVLVRRYIE